MEKPQVAALMFVKVNEPEMECPQVLEPILLQLLVLGPLTIFSEELLVEELLKKLPQLRNEPGRELFQLKYSARFKRRFVLNF